MKNRLLIFDLNATLWKYMFKHDGKFYDDYFTGGLYGFLQAFSSTINRYKPNNVIVTLDTPPYKRKEAFSGYKGNRKKDSDILKYANESREYIDEFLEIAGIQAWGEPGLEADDLIYMLCEKYHPEFREILLACTDDDLYQCFDFRNVYMIKKQGRLYGRRLFFREHKMTPEEWIRYSVVKGTHNNIKGVPGLGKKKARKYISANAYEDICQKHRELLLYEELIRLPYEECPVPKLEFRGVDRHKLRDFLQKFGIRLSVNEYFKAAVDYLDSISG